MSDANRTGCGWYLEEDDEAGDPEGGEEGVVDQVEDGDLQPGQGSPAGGGLQWGMWTEYTDIVRRTLYTVHSEHCTVYAVHCYRTLLLYSVHCEQSPVSSAHSLHCWCTQSSRNGHDFAFFFGMIF